MSSRFLNSDRRVQAAAVLREIYAAHDELTSDRPRACRAGCHTCCGDAVLLTTLEGRLLGDALFATGRESLFRRAAAEGPEQTPPAATFNQHAGAVLGGRLPKPEPSRSSGHSCPVLLEGLCAAYEARPFACRAMSSREVCQPGGSALQDEWWVVLDTAFFQLVEQADTGGGFGPLGKVASWLVNHKEPHGLLICQDLPGLPAPEVFSGRLSEAIKRLMSRPLGGRPLGHWMTALRRS